ncbi:MAG: peroxiredoxin [Gemmatimonadetes bacterium]|nr:peroxiredoxin [Gemmatimonadota bacterium]
MTMPAVGNEAPDFSAQIDDGSMFTLSSLRGSPVVLFFYPKDDTPGCTVEACGFQAALPDFHGIDAKVLGVSPDPVKKHVKFKQKFDLEYPLVADPDHAVCELYGVWGEKSMYGRKYWGVNRTTFVIDAKGRIARVFEKVKPEGHAAEVAEAVAALK